MSDAANGGGYACVVSLKLLLKKAKRKKSSEI